MRVLVTGGAGFIGSHICHRLVERGHTVLALDDFSSGKIENIRALQHEHPEQFDWIEDDIIFSVAKWTEKSEWIKKNGLDAICHQAAQPSLLESVKDPARDAMINIVGTINVIQAARNVGARVVLASTSAVYYDDPHIQPYLETHSLGPSRPYGIAKMSAEFYVRTSGLPYTILRYGNVYGPRQVAVGENQLVPHALDHIYRGQPFTVNGDGWQTRDFVFVGDIAEANVKAIENNIGGIYNVGSGKAHSVNEVLTVLKELTKFPGDFEHGLDKPNEPRRVLLDSTAAHERLGWWAGTSLFDGLKKTVRWYEQVHSIVEKA